MIILSITRLIMLTITVYEHKNNGGGAMRNAIQESIMMANIDNRRRLNGKVPLDVTQLYKKCCLNIKQ